MIMRSHRLVEDTSLNIDKQATRMLAQNFFNQMRASGYTSRQMIGMATELLDLVTEDIKSVDKDADKDVDKGVAPVTHDLRAGFRQEA